MMSNDSKINMIKQQLRTGDVLNENIIELYHKLSRENFLPAEMKNFAYSDLQIPLPNGQRMLTPLEEGKILTALDLKGHECVLEIGTGTGFMTAMLASQAKHVVSIEYYSDLSTTARKNLQSAGISNVQLEIGDGYNGWMDKAPFDVVVYTGAIDSVNTGHKLQVLPGGKLFVIIGHEPVMQGELHLLDHSDNWQHQLVFETCIPPLINKLKPQKFVF